jgi:hypothetical protein
MALIVFVTLEQIARVSLMTTLAASCLLLSVREVKNYFFMSAIVVKVSASCWRKLVGPFWHVKMLELVSAA